METKVMFYNAAVLEIPALKPLTAIIRDISPCKPILKCFSSKEYAAEYLYKQYLNVVKGVLQPFSKEEFIAIYLIDNNPLWLGSSIFMFQIQEQEDENLAASAYYDYDLVCRMEDVECELERRGIKASEEQIKNIAIKANDVLSDSDEWWYAIDYAIIQFERGRV